MERIENPGDEIRKMDVTGDDSLSADEKEFIVTCPNTEDFCYVYSEIPTFVKWMLSISDSDFEWARINSSGQIIAAEAKIPKGYLHMKPTPRKSDNHSNMVSYGPER